MHNIAIISSSIRPDRKSHRLALYFKKYLNENFLANAHILDLKEYDFPIFSQTFKKQKNPIKKVMDFAEKIAASDGVIIVTPEYNGGYPASLKNAVDLLYEEWRHKPVGIVTVSSGPFAGSQVLVSFQFSLWKMKAWTITEQFAVPDVEKNYDEEGNSLHKKISEPLTEAFIKELFWCIKADKNLV
ncbi:MAG: NAD(P)H-dependent oxidoreductase [Leadbetterella sp.]|jgi:NAD(P)H-dependent FMN reductase|nr:NAD(P)H-dependent oxidoreductase [Leadbetterella sp.]